MSMCKYHKCVCRDALSSCNYMWWWTCGYDYMWTRCGHVVSDKQYDVTVGNVSLHGYVCVYLYGHLSKLLSQKNSLRDQHFVNVKDI